VTEVEYLNATNLAKLRQAASIIRDCLGECGGAITDEDLATAACAVYAMTEKLEKVVKVGR